jgi:hypothetical protein
MQAGLRQEKGQEEGSLRQKEAKDIQDSKKVNARQEEGIADEEP